MSRLSSKFIEMNIKELILNMATQLRGHNALIQIQVDGQYIIKHIGDVNKLVDNPTLLTYKEDSSFDGRRNK